MRGLWLTALLSPPHLHGAFIELAKGNVSATCTAAIRSGSSASPAPVPMMNLYQVAEDIVRRLASTFLRDADACEKKT